jgi:hypothetical protein
MFEHLTARLSRSIENLRGRGRITEENVATTLREARVALLEADVALPVVKSFIEAVKVKALGAEVLSSLTPGQAFIGILHEELKGLMGGAGAGFRLRAQPPVSRAPARRRRQRSWRAGSSSARRSAYSSPAPTCAGPPRCCNSSDSQPRSVLNISPPAARPSRRRSRVPHWSVRAAACSMCSSSTPLDACMWMRP